MSRAQRRALVEREAPALPVSRQCQLLAVSRAWVYRWHRHNSPAALTIVACRFGCARCRRRDTGMLVNACPIIGPVRAAQRAGVVVVHVSARWRVIAVARDVEL